MSITSSKTTVPVPPRTQGLVYGYFITAPTLLRVLSKRKELEGCPKLTDPYTAVTTAMRELLAHANVFGQDWKNIKVGKHDGWCIVLGRNTLEAENSQGSRVAMVKVGLSTIPYTATAVLLTVSIRPWAVPYGRRIHEVESPRRYGTVIATAGIWVKTAIRNEVT